MREILFRGKAVESGEWKYGDLTFYAGDAQIWETTDDGKWNFIVDLSTIGQFTGLRDCNSTRIFEGDIVRVDPTLINGREFDGYSAVVGFTGGAFGLERVDVYCHRNAHYLEHGFCEVFWPFGHCEYLVIGNIHDNPEMLSA